MPPYPAFPEGYDQQPRREPPPQPRPQPQTLAHASAQPQPQPQMQMQMQMQYVNPAELFQQTPLPTPPRPHFHASSQLDGQPPASAPTNNQPPPATPSKSQSHYNVPTPSQSTANIQPPQPVTSPPQVQPPSTPSRPIPQVLVPAPSPEVQQKIQQQTPRKQTQRRPKQPSKKSSKPPIDYQILLLSLADEYLSAAHSQGTMVALERREMELGEYYKLVATGLGCLEAVLKVISPFVNGTAC